ncbi:MAG TPA: glycosyltransferase family 2 protein [Bacteroidetes bacterium]|nr:glycosyltransferase family 2 protein [Bacteroidota bacterium]
MMVKLPQIAVLLSSYNGEKFIEEQIQSILNQQNVSIHLLIRDDGSTDRTHEIAELFATKDTRISIIKGKNKGVVLSFFDLLQNVDENFDFYAFADQDDVWKPNKLEKAAEMMSKSEVIVPAMYYSRLEFTDEHLNTIGYSIIPKNRGFENAIVQNQATGCTIVINGAARKIIITRLPSWALMHDWWFYLVVSAMGDIYYDEFAGILYRKHGNNVTPATPWFALELYARVKRYLGHGKIPEKVTDQVREFYKLYQDILSKDQQKIINGFLTARGSGFFKRLRYILTMPVRRNTPFDNIILRMLILIGKF